MVGILLLESLPTSMLAPPKPCALDRPVTVSLENLVPADHFYRQLERTLDLSFVREWVKDRYAACGGPSIDPIVFCKLQLILFFEGLRSGRQLVEIASLNLAHRWYLGYNLDEPLPDHSSLTRIRDRPGLPIFRRFFEHVVELCGDAGLIWRRELLVDATKVIGNASTDSLVPRLAEVVDDHLVELFGTEPPAEHPKPVGQDTAPQLLHPEGVVGMEADRSEESRRLDVLEQWPDAALHR